MLLFRLEVVELVGFVVDVIQEVARLAIELAAQSAQRGKTDGLDLSRFYARQVVLRQPDALRQIVRGHLAAGQHDIQVNDHAHDTTTLRRLIRKLLQRLAVVQDIREQEEGTRCHQCAEVNMKIDRILADLKAHSE